MVNIIKLFLNQFYYLLLKIYLYLLNDFFLSQGHGSLPIPSSHSSEQSRTNANC